MHWFLYTTSLGSFKRLGALDKILISSPEKCGLCPITTDLASWASGRLTGAHMSVKAPQDATHTFPQRHPELTVQGDEMTP